MCILGAVFLDKAVIQPLTPFIPLNITPPDDTSLDYIARILEALRLSFTTLDNFYRGLANSNNDGQQRYFPHFREFTNSVSTQTPFTYISQLAEPTRLVWKAKTTHDQHLIVVKFTQRYNNTAHALCARNQLAPTLLYFGDGVEMLAGFHVVMMDYIDHQPLQPNTNEIQNLVSRRNIYNDVLQAVTLLHNEQYVFADLRNPNILIYTTNGAQHSMLIDFDWCGVDGRDTYPLSLSRKIPWPNGVQPGGLLSKAHDLTWLDVLRRGLKLTNGMTLLHQCLYDWIF